MTDAVRLAEVWRGDFLECTHLGHAVICGPDGSVLNAWGDPDAVVLPRSSAKMIQALPLVESGAADAAGLTTEQLALSCASHNGAAIHTDRVTRWLADLGLAEGDLRCGAHMPKDPAAAKALTCSDTSPCQIHNNCSGKHTGFLTLNKHLGGGAEYIEADHPVQRAVLDAFEDVTGEASPGHVIDGCSAPNFATSLTGLARAMSFFATAKVDTGTARQRAAARLRDAMMEHPALVAGEGRSCTMLMRAMNGKAAIKTGAEAVFVAILPETGHGIALKVTDGATRGSEAAIAALLIRMGVLDRDHPAAQEFLNPYLVNCRGIKAAQVRPAAALLA